MNKWLIFLLYGLLLLFLTGCQGLFNNIPKDKVMIKKVALGQQRNEIEFQGTLSEEALQRLSIQAINRYLGIKLDLDYIHSAIMFVDQNELKKLLEDTIEVAHHASRELSEPRIQFFDDIEQFDSGLYYVTLTLSQIPKESYEIVLNAKNGDVLKMLRSYDESRAVSEETEEKLFEMADHFLEENGDYPFTELTRQTHIIRWGSYVELYYTSTDNEQLKYGVTIDLSSVEVAGFSKDVMAQLSYSAKR